jgi:hypothetical protein
MQAIPVNGTLSCGDCHVTWTLTRNTMVAVESVGSTAVRVFFFALEGSLESHRLLEAHKGAFQPQFVRDGRGS